MVLSVESNIVIQTELKEKTINNKQKDKKLSFFGTIIV